MGKGLGGSPPLIPTSLQQAWLGLLALELTLLGGLAATMYDC